MHLILFVCLLASPAACKIVSVPTEARMPMECFAATSEWLAQHPKYILKWARCGAPEREA
jgi:hypothetical protein